MVRALEFHPVNLVWISQAFIRVMASGRAFGQNCSCALYQLHFTRGHVTHVLVPASEGEVYNVKPSHSYVYESVECELDPIHQLYSVWIVEFSKVFQFTPDVWQALSTNITNDVESASLGLIHWFICSSSYRIRVWDPTSRFTVSPY